MSKRTRNWTRAQRKRIRKRTDLEMAYTRKWRKDWAHRKPFDERIVYSSHYGVISLSRFAIPDGEPKIRARTKVTR